MSRRALAHILPKSCDKYCGRKGGLCFWEIGEILYVGSDQYFERPLNTYRSTSSLSYGIRAKAYFSASSWHNNRPMGGTFVVWLWSFSAFAGHPAIGIDQRESKEIFKDQTAPWMNRIGNESQVESQGPKRPSFVPFIPFRLAGQGERRLTAQLVTKAALIWGYKGRVPLPTRESTPAVSGGWFN